MSIVAVVLAGGRGERMGRGENKVFVPLRGIPAIVRAIAPFSTLCSHLVVVARQEELAAMEQLLKRYGMSHLVHKVVPGGSNRQASVLAGLMALPPDADVVLVHDGARALVTEAVIQRVINSAMEHGSGIASVPVTDTIKRAGGDGRVRETLPREELFAMQTPQGFRVELLRQAHNHALETGYLGTDDAALVEHMGLPVYLCRGDHENIKLTTPLDVALAERILETRAMGGADA
ncbi:MAG: 2-C-methyl-D-erythritol 4-phosphate cytidylyltransferase [Clostridiales bacterium]|nr:2-C-methyl-D-erythritol 4-phosphate cytidylyltransferase [Clostridiales bacterium]